METLVPTTPTPEFFTGLAKAQNEFLPVRKNRVNPATRSKYADLESVFNAVKPALNANGFFLYQKVGSDEQSVSVETLLGRGASEVLSSGVLKVPYSNLQNRGTNSAQALGSARTYACRYSLCSFLCVVAEDDDDGNAATEPQQTPAPSKPSIPQSIRDAAALAATKGLAAYEAYFKSSLDLPTKRLLISSGEHDKNKATAAAVDARGAGHAE